MFTKSGISKSVFPYLESVIYISIRFRLPLNITPLNTILEPDGTQNLTKVWPVVTLINYHHAMLRPNIYHLPLLCLK